MQPRATPNLYIVETLALHKPFYSPHETAINRLVTHINQVKDSSVRESAEDFIY